jgi:hypothetical protein
VESGEKRAAHDALVTFRSKGFGYFLEQDTPPQTIGSALLGSHRAGELAARPRHDTAHLLQDRARLRRR